jgi:selenoprotein W-related protein
MKMPHKPTVSIRYCSKCRFILRATWIAQELLFTFAEDLASVNLEPGDGGVFEVCLDGQIVWNKAQEQRFPEAKELKQRIRDRIDPERSLGHSDR